MGLLLGVARGSAEPPRVIVLRHEPPGAPAAPVLGLVGKGITFDTGGISIKPADGMERMKDDMAGGAAVVCAMRAIALLKAPDPRDRRRARRPRTCRAGRAMKPGDVLTGAGGKTVEVINTDAEGRLILGDALWYAQQLGATHLVDVATLTGACVVALGQGRVGPVRPARRLARGRARPSPTRAGDRCWPLPLYDEYVDQIRSEIADMVNSGGRAGGACTAASVPQGVHQRPAVGAPGHRRHGVGRRGEAVSSRKARSASRCGRWRSCRSAMSAGSELAASGTGSGRSGYDDRRIDGCSSPTADHACASSSSRFTRRRSSDVIFGSLGLVGVLLLAALLLGLLLGGGLILVKRLDRARRARSHEHDAEHLRVTPTRSWTPIG